MTQRGLAVGEPVSRRNVRVHGSLVAGSGHKCAAAGLVSKGLCWLPVQQWIRNRAVKRALNDCWASSTRTWPRRYANARP